MSTDNVRQSLHELILNSNQERAQAAVLVKQAVRSNQESQASQDARAAIALRQGQLASQKVMAEGVADLNEQAQKLKAANAFGTNVGAQSDVITDLAQQMRSDAVEMNKRYGELIDIRENGGFFTRLFKEYGAEQRVENTMGRFQANVTAITGLNAATQATNNTIGQIQQRQTEATIKAAAEAESNTAQDLALQQEQLGRNFGMANIELLQRVGVENMQRDIQLYNATVQNEQWQEGFRLRTLQFEEAQAARDERKMQDEDYVGAAERINKYASAIGAPPVSVNQVKRTITQPGAEGERMRRFERRGVEIDNSGGIFTLGRNAAETLRTIQTDEPRLPETYAPGLKLLESAYSELTALVSSPAGAGLAGNEDQIAIKFNEIAKVKADQLQSNINEGDAANPYAAPPLTNILQNDKQLAESKFGQTVLTDLKVTNTNEVNLPLLLAMGVRAESEGKLTANEVIDGISQYYRAAATVNSTYGGFTAMGLPAQTKYRVRLQLAPEQSSVAGIAAKVIFPGPMAVKSFLDRDIMVDVMDPKDAATAYTTFKSKKRTQEILGNLNAVTDTTTGQ